MERLATAVMEGILCYRNLTLECALLALVFEVMQTAKLDLKSEPNSNNGTVVTKLDGKLSLETVHDFIQTLRAEPAAHLVLDMSGVSFLDSAGVGALVSLFVSRKHHGKTFALAGLNQQGYAVIEVSGLLKLLPVFRSVEEAAAKPA